MDQDNLRDLQRMQQRVEGPAKVMLFGEFAGHGNRPEEVGDPYYGAQDGFEVAYEQCMCFSKHFLSATFPIGGSEMQT